MYYLSMTPHELELVDCGAACDIELCVSTQEGDNTFEQPCHTPGSD